jgi:glycosyltransferase involved in cell wall biosynthesis
MTLGFHYHIPFAKDTNNGIFVPGHFGVFLEEIAKHVATFKLFLFRNSKFEESFFDYKLTAKNIKVIELATDLPAYEKYFSAPKILGKHKKQLCSCNKILLRGPSPMNYAFTKYFDTKNICNLVVGDYGAGIKHIVQPFYRILPVKILNYLMHKSYISSLKGTAIAFNSEELLSRYKHFGFRSKIINTGNVKLSDISIVQRADLGSKNVVKMLYVGRIDWAKGFKEMLESLPILNKNVSYKFELHIVGWDETRGESVLEEVKDRIKSLDLIDYVFFHGKKKPGPELNRYYKDSDLFVLASYQEGFPRTIWEAFANGLPVLTTPVGSIPLKLKDKQEVLFFKPHDVDAFVKAVFEIVKSLPLRMELVKNGYDLVVNNTIEIQVKQLINFALNE